METDDLSIKEIRSRAVIAPLKRPITTAHAAIPAAPLVLIDVECTNGIIGRSYIFGYTPVSLKPLVILIASLDELLRGKLVEPVDLQRELRDTFRLLGAQGLLGMAISGLDMALWDALAKSVDCSVAKILGGGENPITCYDGHGIYNPKTSPNDLENSLKKGFSAVKFKVGGGELQADIDAVKAIRDIVGEDIKLMIDYNQSLDAPEAIRRINALSQYDLHWVEEPVLAEDFVGHAAVRNAVNVSIQTGENWWFPENANQAITAGASDHAMLDIMKIGGFTGWARAAAIANAAALPVSSHTFVEASAHAMAVTPGAHMLEFLDIANAVMREPYVVVDGMLAPRGPGLGIEWNEAAVERFGV